MLNLNIVPSTSGRKIPEVITAKATTMGALGMSAPSGNIGVLMGRFLTDTTAKKIYAFSNHNAGPWIFVDRYDYSIVNNRPVIGTKTAMTLSGFGTFTSQPQWFLFQNAQNTRWYAYFHTNGGSGSITAATCYEITIAGTTITLGASIAIPVIGSYERCFQFADGDNVWVFYRNTSTGLVDTGRKWDRSSWTTLSGAALPTSINAAIAENATYDFTQAQSPYVNAALTRIVMGTKFYKYFVQSAQALSFDTVSATWAIAPKCSMWHTDKDFVLGYSAEETRYYRIDASENIVTTEYASSTNTYDWLISDWAGGNMAMFTNTNVTTNMNAINATKPYFSSKRIRRIGGTVSSGVMTGNETIIKDGSSHTGFSLSAQNPALAEREYNIAPASGQFIFYPIACPTNYPISFWME
jgi:hypothetical protein